MRITLIRHGVAEDKKIGKSDFDRELTPYGRKKLLKHFETQYDILQSIDTVLCSSSLRTRQTCALLYSVIPFDTEKIIYDKRIYKLGGGYDVLSNIIEEYSHENHHICLVGHNDSISAFASYLAGEEIVMRKGEIKTFSISNITNVFG